jgi:hypothetical protein
MPAMALSERSLHPNRIEYAGSVLGGFVALQAI